MTTLESLLKEELENCSVSEDGKFISGYVKSEENYKNLVDSMQVLGFSYSIRDSRLYSGDNNKQGPKIYFKYDSGKLMNIPQINFFGAPFTVEKITYMQCSQGPNMHGTKQKVARVPDTPCRTGKRSRVNKGLTRKHGCPAVLSMKCVRVYPEFTAVVNKKRRILGVAKKLKEALKNKSILSSYLRFYIKVSLEECHNHSTVRTQLCQGIHPELVAEVKRLVGQGVTTTKEVKLHLDQYVEHKFFGKNPPNRFNKAFYPDNSVIRTHIYRAIGINKKAQEVLQEAIDQWKTKNPDDSFFFRPHKDSGNGNVTPLLFCHQTKWQRQLLLRYSSVCLLDAVYKTIMSTLPLYFLVAKTNVGYHVAGTFVVQAETAEFIGDALNVFKEWLPNWQPDYWVTSLNRMEIDAVENAFRSSTVYICAFHREQTWSRWVREDGNVVPGDAEDILNTWHSLAALSGIGEFELKVRDMKVSSIMEKNSKAAHYFAKHWLPEAQRWVQAFSRQDYIMILSTNNGIESQKEQLKHSSLCQNSVKSLSGLLKTIVDCYLPEIYWEYCYKNSTSGIVFPKIPAYLKNRPHHFINHVLSRINAARSEFSEDSVTEITEGTFGVLSSESQTSICYVDVPRASCTCLDFKTFRFPCKHMCAVFEFVPSWSFLRLNSAYLNSPYITLDFGHGCHTDKELEYSPPSAVAVYSESDPIDETDLAHVVVITEDEVTEVDMMETVVMAEEQPDERQVFETMIITEQEANEIQLDESIVTTDIKLSDKHLIKSFLMPDEQDSETKPFCTFLTTEEQLNNTISNSTFRPLSTSDISSSRKNFCAETKMLLDLSYICNDKKFLDNATLILKKIHKQMEEQIRTSCGLTTLNSSSAKTSFIDADNVKAKYQILPLSKKYKRDIRKK